MSMGMWFRTVSADRFKSMLDNPESLEDYIELDPASGGPKASFGFGTEWHAMSFLLIDQADSVPATSSNLATVLCLAGDPLENSFDMCHAMSPLQAREAALALQAFPVTAFTQRVESDAFQSVADDEIYHGNYWKQEAQFGELANAYARLQTFFFGAAKRNEGVIHYVT